MPPTIDNFTLFSRGFIPTCQTLKVQKILVSTQTAMGGVLAQIVLDLPGLLKRTSAKAQVLLERLSCRRDH